MAPRVVAIETHYTNIRRKSSDSHETRVHPFVGPSVQKNDFARSAFFGCDTIVKMGESVWKASRSVPGVPRSAIFPGTFKVSSTFLTAIATATPEIAIRLWPQACPMPGSASISELTPRVRPPSPCAKVASQAVSSSQCRLTSKPCFSMNAVRTSWA